MHKKKVMVFGTFDDLHAGHENLFTQAAGLGDVLIVVVARDETVRRVKGKYPENTEKKRLAEVKNHPLVTKAVLGELADKHTVIRKYKPDIIALGYDQFVFTYTIKKTLIDAKINAEIMRLKPYNPNIYKSSLMRERTQRPLKEREQIVTPQNTPLTPA